MILKARRELPRHVWKPASRSRRAVRRSYGVRRGASMGEVILLGTLKKKGERQRRAAPCQQPLQGTRTGSDARTLGPRACVRPKICVASPCSATAPRASAPLRPAPGASEDGAAPNHLSTCHRPARAALSPRALTRALRRSCARTPKSGQLVPVQRPTDGAECARVLCRCRSVAAKAPTQRAARRNRRRMWCLGLRLDAHKEAPNVVPRPAA